MPVSNSINFSLSRNQVIQEAMMLTGQYGQGRQLSDFDLQRANNALNMMIKGWARRGIFLWAQKDGVLFLDSGTEKYTLGSSSDYARCADWDDTVITQLNGGESSSATSLTVDTTTGMTVGDFIGIVQDGDTVKWTTIATIPDSTTVTISSGLSDDAADNSFVYTFTSRITKPLKLVNVRRSFNIGQNSTETSLVPLSKMDYDLLQRKQLSGTPTHFYFDPEISAGKMWIWPVPNDPDFYIRFTYQKILDDMDTANDSFEFPQEWLETITYQLAVRLCNIYNRPERKALIKEEAEAFLFQMLLFDTEDSSIYFTMQDS